MRWRLVYGTQYHANITLVAFRGILDAGHYKDACLLLLLGGTEVGCKVGLQRPASSEPTPYSSDPKFCITSLLDAANNLLDAAGHTAYSRSMDSAGKLLLLVGRPTLCHTASLLQAAH